MSILDLFTKSNLLIFSLMLFFLASINYYIYGIPQIKNGLQSF